MQNTPDSTYELILLTIDYFSVRRDFMNLTKSPIETRITKIKSAHFSLRIIPFPPMTK